MTRNPLSPDANSGAKPAPEIIWRGSANVYADNPVAWLFWPFAKAKQVVESLYDAVVHSVWDELVHGKRDRDAGASVLGLALIAVFALVIYQVRAYEDVVIAILIGMWFLDRWLAQNAFDTPATRTQVAISVVGQQLRWRTATPRAGVCQEDFRPNDIECVCLERVNVHLGAFVKRVGARWRGSLVLTSGEGLLLFDEADATSAWRRLRQAGETFKTPVKVGDSLGEMGLASDQSFNRARYSLARVTSFDVEVGPRGAQIVKKLGFSRFSTLLGKVLMDGGLPFFMLLTYFMMIRLGALLSALLANYLPIPYEQVVMNLSPSGIFGFFVPDFSDPLRIVEFLGVLSFLAYKAWRLMQPLELSANRDKVEVCLAGHAQGSIDTQNLVDIVLIESPSLSILLIDGAGQTFELEALESREEYLHMLAALKTVTQELRDQTPEKQPSISRRVAA